MYKYGSVSIVMKLRVFILLFVFCFIAIQGISSQEVYQKIHNWTKLSSYDQGSASLKISSIVSKRLGVLDEFKIPLEMTYYSTNLNSKYYAEFNNNKMSTVVVGYVPLQFVEYYEQELQSCYVKKDSLNLVPRLDVLLAIHYTESNFVPTALAGTKENPSFGMMQLTLESAKDLYKRDKETYQKYFSINDSKVEFNSNKDQVSLTIKFLTDIKFYSREYETRAIRRYNGSGDDAINYASLVLARARLYKKMRTGKEVSSQEFVEELATKETQNVINNQLEVKELPELDDEEFKIAIEKALLVYDYNGQGTDTLITIPASQVEEVKKPFEGFVEFPPIPNNGCDYFIKIAEGRTLYSHFRSIRDMVYVMCNEKNSKFELFYKTKDGKKVLKSMYDIDTKNNNMQTNIKTGDVIFLPPDVIIKGNTDTYYNMSRVCEQ